MSLFCIFSQDIRYKSGLSLDECVQTCDAFILLNGPLKSFKHGVLKEIPSARSQPKTPGSKTMVSVLHKGQEFKVEKLKYKKLDGGHASGDQNQIRTSSW